MRSAIALLVLVLLSWPLQAQQQGQFVVVLTSADGQPVTSINPADLSVNEAEKPAKVLKVEPRSFPMRVTLALEPARGFADAIVQLRAGAKGFVNALPAGVEITLVSTAPQPRVIVKGTTNKEEVLKALDRLAPESTPGRYVEAVTEQIQRWDKDKDRGLYTPIMVVMGSTFGEEVVRSNWINEAMDKLTTIAGAAIHSVMYEAPLTATGGGGDFQMDFARQVSQRTRGRFESFAAAQRIGTLLPEIGAEIAKTQSASQFLVTIERPAGATGRMTLLSMSPPSGVKVGKITVMEPRK
jgi:hypothetical protein